MIDWKALAEKHEDVGNLGLTNSHDRLAHHTLALICRALADMVPQERLDLYEQTPFTTELQATGGYMPEGCLEGGEKA